ncbi:MAG: regulatory signaling modulator protein AmpE [Xanthomonadales bacterium]|nr:regulatory signaling modulator protein AmpE [Xanthomonadales bacterium]MCA0197021.1 regulatory signaling modulator protein AmpE [Pseudomonadota bacterium]
MFVTLVAVIAALVLGHVAPALVAAMRQFQWFAHWLEWLGAHASEGAFWRRRHGIWLALLPPVLALALIQFALGGRLFGLGSLVLGVLVLVWTWGPRDLDTDVEAVLDAQDPQARRDCLARLAPEPGVALAQGSELPGATMRSALRRWFAPLLWFLLLGPAGALLYRLVERATLADAGLLPAENAEGARTLLRWLEWPVAQLMALALALAGNFDRVFRAWRGAGGDRWQADSAFLEACARAAVRGELAEEADDYLREGQPLPETGDLVELRDAMSLVWRMLLLWLALLALLIIAGWVS